ncbi:MAG: hypothetical protein GY788_03075, partial [bacterium]|nr:hypothetical protein [bacterium]
MIYKRKDLPSCTGANNNTDILYFLSTSALHPHIDRICFSCSCRSDINKPEQTLFSILKDNNYVCVSNSWIKQDKYKRITMYHSNLTNINVSILYERTKQYSFYPCMRIIIFQPDIDIIDRFDAICNSIGFTTTLSHVELAIDISPYNFDIHEFLMRYLFLKYHRGTSCTVEGEGGS